MDRLKMARVRQQFARPRVEDVPGEIATQMKRFDAAVRPGMSVAVTAGSRGINGIPLILRTVVSGLREMGARPFIVSAMGSHGGGTPEGQENLLRHLGITEESVGAPLRITSETVEVGATQSGKILYADAEAAKADGIFVVNRIKPHTAFQDALASGLFKMITVGLGKVPGATQVHKLGSLEMYPAILDLGHLALRKLPILGGLVIVENSLDETARLEAVLPQEMEARERDLLEYATGLLPRLPLDELDMVIVEETGKNFSGTGMDTNVIGRWNPVEVKGPVLPQIKRVVVLRLSEASEGNANGIGLADFTTRKLVDAIDWKATLTNVRTTGFWVRAFCPPFPGADLQAIEWALESLKLPPGQPVVAARIRNTLHLGEIWLTESALAKATQCERAGEFHPLEFNGEGDLLPGV
ncbi:MAG: nickel-dependent lactate racemase [Syntrophales bacterium LBB04]|nr:nickel-dependent lactate racemase [Syntrophales bacterium LBB04]